MKQKEKTLRWLEKQRDKIDRDIMHYVHLIKDVRYEQAATASLKDLSSQKTACIDCIAAVKYMYKKLNEEEANNTIHITYGKDDSFYLRTSEKEYKIEGE